ncbi:hypothetical protein EU546_07700, partial [Candidatus Thorarchaeota archaeon]
PGYSMCQISLNQGTELLDLSGEPENHSVMYWGGPYFVPDESAQVEILAKYSINDEPAMIAFEQGASRVFLSGPHPEWEEDSTRDGQDWGDLFDDRGSEWPMMLTVACWLTNRTASTTSTTETTPPDVAALTGAILVVSLGTISIVVYLRRRH